MHESTQVTQACGNMCACAACHNMLSACAVQASLKIDESDRHLSGGAVHFQATYAVQDLGALPYVSSGEPAIPCYPIMQLGKKIAKVSQILAMLDINHQETMPAKLQCDTSW